MSAPKLPEGTTCDQATMIGPEGLPIPLLHFDDEQPTGTRLAVSLAAGRAVLTIAATPLEMLVATPVMLSPADRQALARWLLAEDGAQ